MRNVRIEVTGARASGVTTAAKLISNYFQAEGCEVKTMDKGETIIVSGEVEVNKNLYGNCEQAPQTDKPPQTILQTAHEVIYGDREQTYGDPGKNLSLIAKYWEAHLNSKYDLNLSLTTSDVSGMMVLLKQARLANSPGHTDSLVDVCGYAALEERIQKSKVS